MKPESESEVEEELTISAGPMPNKIRKLVEAYQRGKAEEEKGKEENESGSANNENETQ